MNAVAQPARLSPSVTAARPSVLIVGPLPPPPGGMANQTRQLARLLAAEGCRVDVVAVNAPYRPAWVANVRGVRALFRIVPYAVRLWRAMPDCDVVHVMANSGWAWHLLAAPAVWIAHFRGRPVIVNYRGGEADAFLARRAGLVRLTLARARALVVPSAFLEDVFARRGLAADIVPNIVDVARFGGAPSAVAGRWHCVVARNLEDIYAVGTALRAFARIRAEIEDARLTIAGDGPARAALERLCAELRLDDAVAFTGRVDNERMADIYRSADVLLNPSLADNMPISLLEAMAGAVPIVSTNVGGIPFMVEHGKTALLVPPRDAVAMASAALSLARDPALAARLREAARNDAQRYAWPRVRDAWFAAYAKAMEQPARPSERAPIAPAPRDDAMRKERS